MTQLLPNYLPFAADLALKVSVPIEVVHFGAIILAVIAALLILEILKWVLSGTLAIIACIIAFGLVAVFGFTALPILIIGTPGFLLGKWIYNKIRRRQLSNKIWSKYQDC